MSQIRQMKAATRVGLAGITARWRASLSTVVAVALVVGVLMAFLAMANGFRRTITAAADPTAVVILHAGARNELGSAITLDQVRLIEQLPGTGAGSRLASVSPEAIVVVTARGGDGRDVNVTLRGIDPQRVASRAAFRLAQGRMFSPGSAEIIIGRAAAERLDGARPGAVVRMGNRRFQVVGLFTSDGSVLESEAWGDLRTVQSLGGMGSSVQIVRIFDGGSATQIQRALGRDPRLQLEAKAEADYFADQSRGTGDFIQRLGWPLAILIALGAIAGALNTMYASVAARGAEIATLRVIGFRRFPVFVATMVESLLLSIAGGLLGVVLVFLALNGLQASSLGQSYSQVVFNFAVSPALAAQALILALSIGTLGGLFPAIRAARKPVGELDQ